MSPLFIISCTCKRMRKWRTIMKKMRMRSSPLSERISSTLRDSLRFFCEIESVSLNTEEVMQGIQMSSIIFRLIFCPFARVFSFCSSLDKFQRLAPTTSLRYLALGKSISILRLFDSSSIHLLKILPIPTCCFV